MKTLAAAIFLIAMQMNLSIQSHIQKYENVFEVKRYNMPDSCAEVDATYCFEKGKDYPDEIIETVLRNITKLSIDDSYYDDRGGFDDDCPSNKTNKPIYYILDKFGSVRVVVQMPNIFEQLYTVEWCLKEGKINRETPHFMFNTTIKEHDMECVNMRMDFDFFVLSEGWSNVGEPVLERVQAMGGIPVCCRCRVMD